MRIASALLAICCCLSASSGHWLGTTTKPAASSRPGFDPNEVVRHVHSAGSNPRTREPSNPILDDGEFLIDTSITRVPAPRDQDEAAIAFDGTNFLAVWQDDCGDGYSDIFGARVTPEGVVLDPAGIAIATGTGDQEYPALAFDGTNFLVTWDDVTWTNSRSTSCDISGTRVTPAGVVLDPAGIAISTAAGFKWYPALAFDGENFLVVWQDDCGSTIDIYGARVTPAGVVLDSTGIAISTEAWSQEIPGLAFDGESFLVVWQDDRVSGYRDIYGARVTPAGVVLDSAGVAISAAARYQDSPAVAFDGHSFLAVWHDDRSAPYRDIYGARVTPAAVVLDSAGIVISTAAYGQYEPVVAFDGTNSLVVWEDERTGGAYDIYGARVTTAGVVLDPTGFAISTAAGVQWSPALAFDGTNFLVVWGDKRTGAYDIYGARVTPAGAVLDSAGIAISTAAGDQRSPALAFDGENFLVAWQDNRSDTNSNIYGARVTPAGVVLDPAGIAISTAAEYQQSPALAFDGQNVLVAWQDQRGGGGHDDIYGARVTPAGDVLDTAGIAISTATGEQRFAVLAFDGENFLVVWETYYEGVRAARVTPAGVVLDPTGITVTTALVGDMYPALAFDGENSLVVWQDSRGGSGVDLYRARVRPDGTVFDKGLVVSQEGNQSYPALARGSGNQVFLVYQGWAGVVGNKAYGADRIWGKMNPSPAVAEMTTPGVRMTNGGATIVRGVLLLPPSLLTPNCSLLSIDGRKVADLHAGANDVSHLAPGVYFLHEARAQAQAQAVRKVTISK